MPPTRWNKKKMMCFDDGEPMAVARPSNPKRALELTRELSDQPQSEGSLWAAQLWKAFAKQLNQECGPYTFLGYLAKAPKSDSRPTQILDSKGRVIDEMQPGDSITRESVWVSDPDPAT